MGLRDWLALRWGYTRVQQSAVLVKDDPFWRDITNASPLARSWMDVRQEIERCYEAVSTNPLGRRLVEMVSDFVIGNGVDVVGDEWALAFWTHPLNHIEDRLRDWLRELAVSGDLYLVLSRNATDGMSYVRALPSILIDEIEVDENDLERELRYHQLTADTEGKWWTGVSGPGADVAAQVMVHYKIGSAIGDPRGQGDLAQVVRWLERYDLWLEDRVRINRYKGAFLWHVKIDGAQSGDIEQKRVQYSRPPASGSIIVTAGNESWEAINPKIGADEAEADGKAIRLMIAAGSGVPLHFLAEGESATRATAHEMGTVTYRHMEARQMELRHIIMSLIAIAAERAGRKLSDEFDVEMSPVEPVLYQEEEQGNGNRDPGLGARKEADSGADTNA